MSAPSYTPGPWRVGALNVAKIDGFPMNRLPISGGGYAIAAVWAGDARRRGQIMGLQDMHQANAALVSAAPELYESLAALLPLAEAYLSSAPSHPDNGKLEDARAALAKAEGR